MNDRLLDRMYDDLDTLLASPTKICSWLTAYNEHLEGIPSELIQCDIGLSRVVSYLDFLRDGGAS